MNPSSSNKPKLRIGFNSPVILGFALLCFASYGLNLLTAGSTNRLIFSTYRSSLLNPLSYLRAFAHIMGHVSWSHLFGNMMYILILGPMLEEKYGSANILFVMLATGLVASVVNAIFFPGTALIGASGVVFSFILLASITGFKDNTIPLTFILVAILYIGQEVYQAIFALDNVSHLGHILGGLTGSALGFIMNKLRMSRIKE